MKTSIFVLFFTLLTSTMAHSQIEINLYPHGPAQSNGITKSESHPDPGFIIDISNPRIYYYPATKNANNTAAVVICPGGGYAGLAHSHEGSEIAQWFNEQGLAAFVLYYRMPNGHYNIPLEDAQAAMKIIRKRSKEWSIDKQKIGIMGFSAGGHLASTVGTHFKTKTERPSFMILAYPVISMQSEITHTGSRQNLLGLQPSADLVAEFSNDLQVSKKTPATFLLHARDDETVPYANTVSFEQALIKNNVLSELHLFDKGGHGFGMRKQNIPVDNWPNLLEKWMTKQGLITH